MAAGDLPATGHEVHASQAKPVPSRPGGPGRLFGMTITLGLLALYYLGLSANACSNRDLVVLTGGLGMVVAGFLLRSDARYRLAWLACPALTFLLGLPYGHRWGQMERTRLFGLETGPNCQVESVGTAILAALLLAAVASDGIARRVTRRARAR